MKIAVITCMSILMSVIISELIIRYVVKYPDYGIDTFVYGISSNIKWQAQYRPFSRYLNTEDGGYHPYRRNNLGLPGTNVELQKDKVLVMGSSFIEASQVPPDQISVSVFSRMLKEKGYSHLTAINLGRKAHDLYDSWFRYNYYKQKFDHKYTMLIVDQRNSFSRHKQPLDFNLPNGFGTTETRLTKRSGTLLLRSSAYLALMYRGIREIGRGLHNDEINDHDNDGSISFEEREHSFIESVLLCIKHFAKDSASKLIVVSIINDDSLNKQVKEYCDQNGIFCAISDSIQRPVNQLHGSGHFNQKGNYELGELMFQALEDKMIFDRGRIE